MAQGTELFEAEQAKTPSARSTSSVKMKAVYTIIERSGSKAYWTRVGVGFVNQDGSINIRLDAIPINGTLHLRDWEPRDILKVEEKKIF